MNLLIKEEGKKKAGEGNANGNKINVMTIVSWLLAGLFDDC